MYSLEDLEQMDFGVANIEFLETVGMEAKHAMLEIEYDDFAWTTGKSDTFWRWNKVAERTATWNNA